MDSIYNIGLKLSKIGLAFVLIGKGFSQEFTQRFNTDDLLRGSSNFKFLYEKNLSYIVEDKSTDLIAFRFNSRVDKAKLVWVRCIEDAPNPKVNPFTAHEQKNKKYEFLISSVDDLFSDASKKDSWKIFNNDRLLQFSVQCSIGESNQEENFLRMRGLGDETYLLLFVKVRGKFHGGQIINPQAGTNTHTLVKEFDDFFRLNE